MLVRGKPELDLTGPGLRSTQHSPIYLNLVLNSQFNSELNTHFIIYQYIEKLYHNSQLRTTRLNNYHAHFYSEIDSCFILDP
jgi:hypothetical protein